MNKKQTIVMWVGIAFVVLMGLFPPWMGREETPPPIYLGRFFISSPPNKNWLRHHRDSIDASQIGGVDFTRLSTQWIMVSVVAGGLIITLKDKKPGKAV